MSDVNRDGSAESNLPVDIPLLVVFDVAVAKNSDPK